MKNEIGHRCEYDSIIIGRNLKRARLNKGLTVDDVREYLRFSSVQAIYKQESGKCYPQADTLIALMSLYEISIDDLTREEEYDRAGIEPGEDVYKDDNVDEDNGCKNMTDFVTKLWRYDNVIFVEHNEQLSAQYAQLKHVLIALVKIHDQKIKKISEAINDMTF